MQIHLKKLILAAALIVIFTIMTGHNVFADEAQAVFAVGCYDVGKSALEGHKGIRKVTRGWKGTREINTVYYDPSEVSIKDIEKTLRKSGTYKETIIEEE